jgi:hypothetical protein
MQYVELTWLLVSYGLVFLYIYFSVGKFEMVKVCVSVCCVCLCLRVHSVYDVAVQVWVGNLGRIHGLLLNGYVGLSLLLRLRLVFDDARWEPVALWVLSPHSLLLKLCRFLLWPWALTT